MGILRGFDAGEVRQLVRAAHTGGLRTVEVAMNSEDAEDLIRALRDEFGESMNVGAGTVRTLQQLEQAFEAGAEFIVTPVVNPEIITTCNEHEVVVVPGAFTPTEIEAAWVMGADLVKLFPASRFGPSYVREILAPLDDVKLIPTGGVDAANIGEFLQAGAVGAGVGSTLFRKDRAGDAAWVEGQAGKYVEAYEAFGRDRLSRLSGPSPKAP